MASLWNRVHSVTSGSEAESEPECENPSVSISRANNARNWTNQKEEKVAGNLLVCIRGYFVGLAHE
jgi:hypothetical protein